MLTFCHSSSSVHSCGLLGDSADFDSVRCRLTGSPTTALGDDATEGMTLEYFQNLSTGLSFSGNQKKSNNFKLGIIEVENLVAVAVKGDFYPSGAWNALDPARAE